MTGAPEEDVGEIIESVCHEFDVSIDDLFARNRTAPVAFARQVAMTLVREKTGASYPAIGSLFERHHTDVMHAESTVAVRCETNGRIKAKVDALRQKFNHESKPK